MPIFSPRFIGPLTGLLLALIVWAPASARADWTTYRGDALRSGVDSSSVGSVPFASAWTSPNLGGDMYAEPLVHDGLVIVATEGDQVVALSEATGQVVWRASAGTPVPSGKLPCGDISPTVGITSTPVIDPATNRVFVVADTWDGSNILHRLYAFNVADGSVVAGFPVSAEPPGDVPAAQLQRAGLALDSGQIIIGYGGNAGDCPTYHGWLVSVPENGGPLRSFEVDKSGSQGAIWASGNAPPVDSAGDVWVSTGNGNSSSYDYQESVLKLDPSMDPPLDQWAPSDWASLDSSDADIGSSAPVLLPGGLVFEIGKQGYGYLLSASGLGGTGGTPHQKTSVCSGSWGGAIYSAGIIYVTCSNGLHALSLNASAGTFLALSGWQVPGSANGPPIIAGGLVWATDWNHGTLYGLSPQTGQAVVTQSTPSMDHFATPAASDGRLFLGTGPTVEAYTIANPASATATGSGSTPAPGVSALPGSFPAKCVLKLRSSRVTIHHPKRRRHQKHAPPAYGTVAMLATCDQAAQVKLAGVVTERLPAKTKHGKARTMNFRLAAVQATLTPGVTRTLQLRLSPSLLRALERRIRESGAFTLTSTTAGGTTQVGAQHRLKL